MLNIRRLVVSSAFSVIFALSMVPTQAFALSLGGFTFNDAQFGNSLIESDGGAWSALAYLNSVNTADPGNPGYLTGANVDTGIADINSPLTYTIGYGTSIVNGAGADIGVITARYSINDTITLTINGNTVDYGPGLAVDTGVPVNYFVGGTGFSASAELYVTSVDLSDFGLALNSSVNTITVTGAPELDLIRVAGLDTTTVPEPASIALFGVGLLGFGVSRQWRSNLDGR